MNRLRVLIVDDEPLARDRLRAWLLEEPSVEIVGECGSGTEALALIRSTPLDLVFLDMQMPGCDGLQAVAGLEPSERPAVVFVTAHERFAAGAFDIRAADYVLKPFDRQRLMTALERAAEFVRARRAGFLNVRVEDAVGASTATGQPEPTGTTNPCKPE